jgi:hypothetical protein
VARCSTPPFLVFCAASCGRRRRHVRPMCAHPAACDVRWTHRQAASRRAMSGASSFSNEPFRGSCDTRCSVSSDSAPPGAPHKLQRTYARAHNHHSSATPRWDGTGPVSTMWRPGVPLGLSRRSSASCPQPRSGVSLLCCMRSLNTCRGASREPPASAWAISIRAKSAALHPQATSPLRRLSLA